MIGLFFSGMAITLAASPARRDGIDGLPGAGRFFSRSWWFMRFLLFLTLLTACGGQDRSTAGADAGSADTTAAVVQKDPARQALIGELHRLKKVFASGDKNQVADLFPFPAPDTVLSVYLDDETFGDRLRKNSNQLSREIFLEFYPQLSQAMAISDMDSLFRLLPIDSLANRDILERYFPVKGEPCVKYYRITIEGESVVLVTGIDSSKDYVNPDTKEKEILSEVCESAMVWIFRFDGLTLTLKQHTVAG